MSNLQADGYGRIAGFVGALVAATAIAVGVLEPGRPGVWLTALVSVAVGFGVHRYAWSPRRETDAEARRKIDRALILAGVILFLPLAGIVLQRLSVIELPPAELSRRTGGLIQSVILIVFANLIPKTPVNHPAWQAALRVCGWTLVTTGLLHALAWLALPVEMARPWGIGIVAAGLAVVLLVIARQRLRGDTPPAAKPGSRTSRPGH